MRSLANPMLALCQAAWGRLEFLRRSLLISAEERTHARPCPVHRICALVRVRRLRAPLQSLVRPAEAAADGGGLLCHSYVRPVRPPSISYALPVHFHRAMRLPIRTLSRPVDTDHRAPSAAGDCPTAGEVLTEIGLLLAIHVVVALAVTETLRLLGIA